MVMNTTQNVPLPVTEVTNFWVQHTLFAVIAGFMKQPFLSVKVRFILVDGLHQSKMLLLCVVYGYLKVRNGSRY